MLKCLEGSPQELLASNTWPYFYILRVSSQQNHWADFSAHGFYQYSVIQTAGQVQSSNGIFR